MAVKSNGTTLIDAGALDSGVTTGDLVLITTVTASSSATLDFTSSINSTYKEYHFKYIRLISAYFSNKIFKIPFNYNQGRVYYIRHLMLIKMIVNLRRR